MVHIFVVNNNLTKWFANYLINIFLGQEKVLLAFDRIKVDSNLGLDAVFQLGQDSNELKTILDSNEYYLYCPHDGYAKKILRLNSYNCKKVSYIEEGDLSYSNSRYKYSDAKIFGFPVYKLPGLRKLKRTSKFFIGNCFLQFSAETFPFAKKGLEKVQRYCLKDVLDTCTLSDKNGVNDASILLINRKSDYRKLKKFLSSNSFNKGRVFAKYHPVFEAHNYIKIKSKFDLLLIANEIKILDSNFFVEYYAYKYRIQVIGSRSSVIRYANLLGFEYVLI